MPVEEQGDWQSGISWAVDPVELSWFDGQIAKFQRALTDVDTTRENIETMLVQDITNEQVEFLQSLLSELYEKQSAFRAAADAFNSVTGIVNSVGGEIAPIRVPAGLGLFPALGIPAAWAAAIAGASLLIAFAVGWMKRANTALTSIAADISDPVKRDAALAESAKIAARTDPVAARTMANQIGQVDFRDATLAEVSSIAAANNSGALFGEVSQTVQMAAIAVGALLVLNMLGDD